MFKINNKDRRRQLNDDVIDVIVNFEHIHTLF